MGKTAELSILVLFFLLATAAVLGASVPEGPGENQQSKKVETFLSSVMKAKTLDDVAKAFAAARFSKAELSRLDKRLQQQPYAGKLSALAKQAKSGVAAARQAKHNKKIPDLKLAQQQKRQQELGSRSSLAQKKLQGIIAGKKTITDIHRATRKPVRINYITEQRMRAYIPREGSGASLLGIHIVPVFVGQRLIIRGSRLGGSRGQVVILLDRTMVYNPIISWRDDQIVIDVSHELGPLLGAAQKTGTLWVKLHGSELGPTTPITLKCRHPLITSTSTPDVTPGQDILLMGANFGSSPGSVSFRVGASTLPGTVRHWRDDTVLFRVDDDVSGLAAQDCVVTVTNSSGLTGSKTISFTPIHEYELLVRNHTLDRTGSRSGTSQTYTDLDFPLINGWTVDLAVFITFGSDHGHGARWVVRPEEGSSSPTCRIHHWAEAYTYSVLDITVQIIGPRGVPYRR